jgi:uncharacterized C2H2 Zn-finger protein
MKKNQSTPKIETNCPQCGQKLRVPADIGGMLMACPTCGQKFYSDFKMKGAGKDYSEHIVLHLFSRPATLLSRVVKFFFS